MKLNLINQVILPIQAYPHKMITKYSPIKTLVRCGFKKYKTSNSDITVLRFKDKKTSTYLECYWQPLSKNVSIRYSTNQDLIESFFLFRFMIIESDKELMSLLKQNSFLRQYLLKTDG